MDVLLGMVWLSSREDYHYNSVSCWDCHFGMGNDGIVGSHTLPQMVSEPVLAPIGGFCYREECEGHGHSASWKRLSV